MKENGLEATVSGAVQTASVNDFDIITEDGNGLINVQYNYQVISPEGAARYYWDYDENIHAIDNIIETALLAEVRDVKARDIPSGYTERNVNGRKTRVNFLEEAEKRANDSLKYQKTGIEITKFAITEPRFNPKLQESWAAPEIEKNNIEAEKHKATQKIIQANAEALVTERQAEATLNVAQKYNDAADRYAESGSDRKKGDIAFFLADLDNNQEVAEKKGRIIKVGPGVPVPSLNLVQYRQGS